MVIETAEQATATILITNFVEDSGSEDNHLSTTEVEIIFIDPGGG